MSLQESVIEKRQERARLVNRMGSILEAAAQAKRDLSEKEKQEFDRLESRIDRMTDDIEKTERYNGLEEDLARTLGRHVQEGEIQPRVASLVTLDTMKDKRVDRETVALRSDQRYSDWQKARGHWDREYEELNLGRLLAGMAGVGRDRLTDTERRALAEGTDSAGGFAVPAPLAGDLIDALRARSTIFRAGATTAPMDSQTLSIARLATDPAATWRAENAAVTEDDPTFESVTFEAITLAVLFRASRELMQDAVDSFSGTLRNSLAQALALGVDLAALEGAGTTEPLGLRNHTGVTEIVMDPNGAPITSFDPLLDARFEVQNANAGDGITAVIMNPRTDRQFAGLAATDNQPLMRPVALQDTGFLTTTQIPNGETQGTEADATHLFASGRWQDLLVGMRQDVTIQLLNERYADNLQVGFLAWLRADVQLAHDESFVRVIGIAPSP